MSAADQFLLGLFFAAMFILQYRNESRRGSILPVIAPAAAGVFAADHKVSVLDFFSSSLEPLHLSISVAITSIVAFASTASCPRAPRQVV